MQEQPTQNITQQELAPGVRAYFDQLLAQRKEIFAHHGATTLKEFLKTKPTPEEIKTITEIYKQLKHISKTKELPESQIYERAQEIFGDQFLGPEQIERAFTLQNGEKLIELTPEQKQEARKKLEQKLSEPGIQEFLAKLESKELKKEDFILVLRIPTFASGKPITMQKLEVRLTPDMSAQGQGKLLYDQDWYESEQFYTTDQLTESISWSIITNDLIPESTNKTFDEQTQQLNQFAQECGLAPTNTTRRTPVQVVYDFATMLRVTNHRILTDPRRYDRTSARTAAGGRVGVGDGVAVGLSVGGWVAEVRSSHIGVVLSR